MHEDWTVGQFVPTDRTGSSSTPDVFVVSGSAAPPPTAPFSLSGAMAASAMGCGTDHPGGSWSRSPAQHIIEPMTVASTLLSWSSGKDSAFALAELRKQENIEVVGLLTTVNAAAARVAMHAVRRVLLEIQAEAVGLPVWTVEIPSPCPNDVYEAAMVRAIERALGQGVTHMAFGDLFLADIRAYRETQLLGTGITPLFPLWGRDTRLLADDMIASGTRAVLTCVDPQQLDAAYAGRSFDAKLLADLPASCDPCGERGEFHTFACDGPAFRHPVPVHVGETVERDGFVFTDVLPA